MDGLQHQVKRHAGMLEHGADLHGELLAALATLFQAVADSAFRVLLARLAANARQIIDTTADDTAMRAANAVRPNDDFEVFDRLGFVVDMRLRAEASRVGKRWG